MSRPVKVIKLLPKMFDSKESDASTKINDVSGDILNW